MTLPNFVCTEHKQVPAKVTAYVDEEIKDLVELLNSFDGVWTMSSCEGNAEDDALITLYFGERWNAPYQKLAQLANELAYALKDISSVYITMEWQGAFKITPFIGLYMAHQDIKNAVDALRTYSNECNKDGKSILCLPH